MNEVDAKLERVAHLAGARELNGILLSRQSSFSWATGGQTNRIDGSVETGSGSLFVAASGARYVVANAIEMPRLRDEALHGLGFDPIEYPWTDAHADGLAPATVVCRHLGVNRIGSDIAGPDLIDVTNEVVSLQVPLTDEELTRYRRFGREAAERLEELCRSLPTGISELSVASRVNAAMAELDARAVVTLVAADERIARFRHPVPTTRTWHRTLLVGLCAERHGLIVALSRIVSHGEIARELKRITQAAAHVFSRLLAATRPEATGAELFAVAATAYRDMGFAGEEARHHQGGAIGYRSRDWIAHPASRDTVRDRQAFAWNPSITGTKVEDTALLVDGTVELITATGAWPTIPVEMDGIRIHAPGVLEV